jgi:hypothetical protein
MLGELDIADDGEAEDQRRGKECTQGDGHDPPSIDAARCCGHGASALNMPPVVNGLAPVVKLVDAPHSKSGLSILRRRVADREKDI